MKGRLLLLATLTLLGACSQAPPNSVLSPIGMTQGDTTLTITSTGLPAGVNPDVTVLGPDSSTRTVTTSPARLTNLREGEYTLTGQTVTDGIRYYDAATGDPLTLKRGGAHAASVAYAARPVTIAVTPLTARIGEGQTTTVGATVGGAPNTSVTWSATCGAVDAGGVFTPPNVSATTACTLTAASVADPTVTASTTVTVEPGGTLLDARVIAETNVGGMAVDRQGNTYLAGTTQQSRFATHAGGDDVYVVKYDRNGTLLWGQQFGSPANDTAYRMAVNDAGDVFAVGRTWGNLFGTHENTSFADYLVVKIASDGVIGWGRQIGSSGDDVPLVAATDAAGSVYFGGWSQGGALNGAPYAGQIDATLIKYDADGTLQWVNRWGTGGWEAVHAIARDRHDRVGEVVTTGAYYSHYYSASSGTTSPVPGDVVQRFRAGDGADVTPAPLAFPERLNAAGLDAAGLVYLGGWTYGSPSDGTVHAVDPGNSVVWDQTLDSGQPDTVGPFADGLVTLEDGTTFVVGSTQGDLFGTNAGPAGTNDGFLARYAPDGTLVWGRQFGGAGNDAMIGVRVTDGNELVVVHRDAGGNLHVDRWVP